MRLVESMIGTLPDHSHVRHVRLGDGELAILYPLAGFQVWSVGCAIFVAQPGGKIRRMISERDRQGFWAMAGRILPATLLRSARLGRAGGRL